MKTTRFLHPPLRKIPSFHLISWCGNFAERHSFRIVSETVPFRKTSTPGNQVKWRYFSQCTLPSKNNRTYFNIFFVLCLNEIIWLIIMKMKMKKQTTCIRQIKQVLNMDTSKLNKISVSPSWWCLQALSNT